MTVDSVVDAEPLAPTAAGRRTDTRAIASSSATPSTASPTTCGPSDELLVPTAETSATGVAPIDRGSPEPVDAPGVPAAPGEPAPFGDTVGNNPLALPPGLSVADDDTPGTPALGRVVVVAPTGVAGAVRATSALASGSVPRPVPVPVAIRLTEETAAASRGTVSSAMSCRWAALDATVPRRQAAVPSSRPQP